MMLCEFYDKLTVLLREQPHLAAVDVVLGGHCCLEDVTSITTDDQNKMVVFEGEGGL